MAIFPKKYSQLLETDSFESNDLTECFLTVTGNGSKIELFNLFHTEWVLAYLRLIHYITRV